MKLGAISGFEETFSRFIAYQSTAITSAISIPIRNAASGIRQHCGTNSFGGSQISTRMRVALNYHPLSWPCSVADASMAFRGQLVIHHGNRLLDTLHVLQGSGCFRRPSS